MKKSVEVGLLILSSPVWGIAMLVGICVAMAIIGYKKGFNWISGD